MRPTFTSSITLYTSTIQPCQPLVIRCSAAARRDGTVPAPLAGAAVVCGTTESSALIEHGRRRASYPVAIHRVPATMLCQQDRPVWVDAKEP